MKLEGVVFLAGFTARSQAYAQALGRNGLVPECTIAYGVEGADGSVQCGDGISAPPEVADVLLPDLSLNLISTVDSQGWKYFTAEEESVNDPALVRRLRDLSPRLVIFCGYGGELVRSEALGIAPFLHVHSGWLPDFRGSTTVYYSCLEEGRLGVSAIILDEKIDTGSVLMRKRYPLPPPEIAMDYLWDPAIRADVLVKVMQHLARHGVLPEGEAQSEGGGRTFYVVHPLLKHMALLSHIGGK